jgi:hypothetical protein
MDGKNSLKSSFPNIKLRHPTNSKHNECAPFVGYGQSKWLWCGMYGVDWKVQFHSKHKLVGETSKIDDKQEMHKWHFIKMLAYPCEHPRVINSLPSIKKCGGLHIVMEWGHVFEKCWIITWNIHPLWKIECYCTKGGLIWKGKNNLSILDKVMWRIWHGHSWTSWM